MTEIILRGITWGHSRGITPLLAFSQRFMELHPSVNIIWEKRSLQQFADYPIEKLAYKYDLLIVDHPWVGCAAATGCIVPLDNFLTDFYLNDQLKNSTGLSHISYYYNIHQWALAIDAAAPVASYRADLLQKNKVPVPKNWEEVLLLAKEGKVAVPAVPIDLLMNFYMFCIGHGKEPFQNEEKVIDIETGLLALETMRQLYDLVNEKMYTCNPIAVAELMSNSNDYWYCPFAYGYSNYARKGYADFQLNYADLVKFKGRNLRSTLGGTGISLSSTCTHKEIGIEFIKSIASGKCQSTFYTEHGGQPGHRLAWLDFGTNQLTNNYFTNTLPALERAYMRPRFNGYLIFQDEACIHLQHYLKKGGNPEKLLSEINNMYRHCQTDKSAFAL